MPYPISEQLLRRNRSYQPLSPIGYVIHSTANKNDSAQKERDYFNTNNLNASVHYFVGATTIIRCVPENEVAWGCGSTGNHKFLQLEMCEGEDFTQVWPRPVSLVAEACVLHRWATGPNVYSHRGISAVSYTHLRAHETRHDLVCRLLLE